MHFGEYELSPSLIGLSPLPSPHPEAFQRLLVRVSRLPLTTIRPVRTRFRFGSRAERVNLAGNGNS